MDGDGRGRIQDGQIVISTILVEQNKRSHYICRLRQKYGAQVYFYNKNVEVDFVVYDEGIAIQVSYSLSDSETEKWMH